MITLSKSGNSVTFTFDENSGYLQNGTIDVPVNSLALITDESDMATFRKAASNDIFISARYAEFGMSKAELEAWYKANMVGSTGGGGGGVTSGEVQSMIDESISGKADTSAVTVEISEAVSGKQDTLTAGRAISLTNNTVAFDLPISAGTGTNSLIMSGSGNTASGEYSVAYGKLNSASGECSTASGNRNSSNNFAEAAFGQMNVSRTEDASSFGHSGNTLFTVGNGIINTTLGINANHNAFEVRGNGDIYIADTNNATGGYYEKPMIKLQDALGGGGKAIEAGRGISITTGETADTVSFNLPISAGTGSNSIIVGYTGNTATKSYSIALGSFNTASGDSSIAVNDSNVAGGQWSFAAGHNTKSYGSASATFGNSTTARGDNSFAAGNNVETKNKYEFGCGYCNVSNTSGIVYPYSGNTLFSVGNGTAGNARHNAFEIKQNGDIYFSLNGQDVKLQDQLGGGVTPQEFSAYTAATDSRIAEDEEVTAAGLNAVNSALGGLKLQQITQSAYDSLVTKDPSTLYIIVN